MDPEQLRNSDTSYILFSKKTLFFYYFNIIVLYCICIFHILLLSLLYCESFYLRKGIKTGGIGLRH